MRPQLPRDPHITYLIVWGIRYWGPSFSEIPICGIGLRFRVCLALRAFGIAGVGFLADAWTLKVYSKMCGVCVWGHIIVELYIQEHIEDYKGL